MEYVVFKTPPFPHFLIAGSAIYRPGDAHGKRSKIGIFDMVFIEEGELFLTDGNTSYHLKKHDFLILKPDSTHYGHRKVSVKTKFKWLHFRTTGKYYYVDEIHLLKEKAQFMGSYIDHEIPLVLPLYRHISSSEAIEFISIFSNLSSATIDKYQQKKTQAHPTSTFLKRQELFLRLLQLIHLVKPQKSSSSMLAENILNYIQENSSSELSLEKIAEQFNFHPAHIIRCIKKEYDTTPAKIITTVRINNAKRLLETSNMPINKVSELVGFSSTAYFSKIFKQYTLMTPLEYRKKSD